LKTEHIAVIPARQGSVGFKFKNRLFFDNTADFLDKLDWFENVIVSSDDEDILDKALKREYLIHHRSDKLSDSNTSIKDVMNNVIKEMKISSETYIWLFYLPILYKNKIDFENLKTLISDIKSNSFCSFIHAKVHPFNCWMYSEKKSKITQYIANDVYRRQDLPDAWEHYHYLCAFKAGCIDSLNSELISEDTNPIFLDENTTDMLVEIDTPKDYDKWKQITFYNKYTDEK
jgi:CMP-N-acetylneuraminic acid synthetase